MLKSNISFNCTKKCSWRFSVLFCLGGVGGGSAWNNSFRLSWLLFLEVGCCFGPRLLIVVLSGRGQCYLYGVPTDISPTVISAVTGLALVVLMIAGRTLAKTIRNCEEQHLLTLKSWRVLGMPEGHTVRLRAERERETVNLGLGLYYSVSVVLQVYSLLANLKNGN